MPITNRLDKDIFRTTIPYLCLLALAVIGGNFLEYVFRGSPFLKGQSVGLIFTLVVMAISFGAWLLVPGFRFAAPYIRVALILLVLLWAVSIARAVSEDTAFNYTALITPLALVMLFFKFPDIQESRCWSDFVSLALSFAIVVTQVLNWTGTRPFRLDINSRWDIPIPWLEIPARWEGMFGDPNNAGFIGAFLLIYGVRRMGRTGVTVSIIGALVILLSQSRTAILAALVGIVVLVFSSKWYRSKRVPSLTTVAFLLGIAFAAFAAVLLTDASFNGRVPIWEAFARLSLRNPLLGIGSAGISEASSSGVIPWRNVDGHNILIDTLVRDGVFAFLLAGALCVVVIIASARVLKFDSGLALAVACTVLASALTYTTLTWSYVSVQALPLLIALTLSQAPFHRRPARS
jgi:hypothetical protein